MSRLRFVGSLLLWTLAAVPVGAQGYRPEEAVKHMTVPPGFQVKLVASEPDLRQPVTMDFDDRGRLWVIQYLQYPTPAGLKAVKVDQYLRTTYDRLPEPPPRGPNGADKITIFEPTGDGRYRKVKDFVTGLNLASGMAVGYGGVFVAQPPYLLFYPDRDGDDVPDSDPEVLLTGFGMEDAHALANSLQWGPDGWLYGAQGSTVTAHIRGIEFQQGIWRYHPRTKEFELFAEGGGNTWGLDFDRHGNVIAGTNYGNSVMLHQLQGAYYIKGFAKHGELHNPYAFGYFDHVPYKGFKGGHVTCGGIVYQGGSFPEKFNNAYIAANPLANSLYWHVIEPKGSSFTARYGGDFLLGHDPWFRPVDCLTGPDGSLFVADWCDVRINHVDPVDNWDRSNGRIYKVEAVGTKPAVGLPVAKRPSRELVALLEHPNVWFVREALRVLGERRDPEVLPLLREAVFREKGRLALHSLWALNVSGGFDDALADRLLDHPNEDVRAWTARLLADPKQVSAAIARRLVERARAETSPVVRSQLACSCKRLPGRDAIPIVRELLRHTEDTNDAQIPLLLWWAVENKADSDRELVLGLFEAPEMWANPLAHAFLVERLARRYMAAGSEPDLAACARLLAAAPSPRDVDLLVRGMDLALEGRKLGSIPPGLRHELDRLWTSGTPGLTLTRLLIRLGSADAYARAVHVVADPKAPAGDRAGLIEVLGQVGHADCVPALLQAVGAKEPFAVRLAALGALQAFPNPDIARTVVKQYPQMPSALRTRAQSLLTGRPAAAAELLRAVDAGRIDPKEIPLDQVRRILLHNDADLARIVEKHWGRVTRATPGEKQARIASVKHMLNQGPGDPAKGHALFTKHCAICHTLFGEGNKVGPELTGADRKDRDFLVSNIVDPSAVIRKDYGAYIVTTTNGRLLTGLIAEETPNSITLVDAKNERTVLARTDVEEIRPSPESLMPEKILDPLSDQDIRDFFAYLQGNGPVAAAPAKNEPLKVCLVSGSLEYHSDESLAAFQQYLESHYNVRCTRAFRRTDEDLPGLENLETCDVALLFTRRLKISGEQLERVKRYCLSGKPIVAVRTASHGFQNWLALDKEVFGGNYGNHYKAGPETAVHVEAKAQPHPVLQGVTEFRSPGSLYKNQGIAADTEVLLTGTSDGHTEPVAWTRLHNGGRVFYTSLGHMDDFKDESFRRLLVNALFWTARRPVETGPGIRK